MSKFERFPLDYRVISASSDFAPTVWKELSTADNLARPMPFLDCEDQFSIGADEFVVKSDAGNFSRPDSPVVEVKSDGEYVGNPPDVLPIYDARFAEMVDILEEFDLEVKNSLHALTRQCEQLSETNEELVSFISKINEQNIAEVSRLHEEIQKSASVEMLSEMFLAIDSKIGELSTKINSKSADHERAIDELEKKCMSIIENSSSLERRIVKQEEKSLFDHEELRKLLVLKRLGGPV